MHADQHTNTTEMYIKSINLVRHSLLLVNTSARLLKGASCPLTLPLGSSSLLPFLHVHFHVVLNWFTHLSIATTPSLQTEWRKCAYMVMRGSLKCHCHFAISPTPQTGRILVPTLDLDHSSSWPCN